MISYKQTGAIGIQRNHLSNAIAGLNQVEHAIQQGQSLLISPEGTRSHNGKLQAFKKGPFHVAWHTQASIVPVMIRGAYESKNRGSFLIHANHIQMTVEPVMDEQDFAHCQSADDLRYLLHQYFSQRLAED